MIAKPEQCAHVGTYQCTVPMPIHGRVRGIDFCIADIVAALNAGGVETMASCCGHKKRPGSILLEDERVLLVCTDAEYEDVCTILHARETEGT